MISFQGIPEQLYYNHEVGTQARGTTKTTAHCAPWCIPCISPHSLQVHHPFSILLQSKSFLSSFLIPLTHYSPFSYQCSMLLCWHYHTTTPSFTCKKHIPLRECSYTWYFTLFSIFVYWYSIDAYMLLFLEGVPIWASGGLTPRSLDNQITYCIYFIIK